MVFIVLVQRVVVSSQYSDLVFIVVVRLFFVFVLFKRVKYIELKQEIKSMVVSIL